MDEKRILIVDDEPAIRRALAEYLTDCGYEAVMAPGGAEGLTLALAGKFHVVLVDLMMPYVDGLEVISVLKARLPELPLVVVSGTGVLDDAVEAMRRGAWDFIAKPIHDIDVIPVVIERVMERARLIAGREWAESQRNAALNELQKAHVELETRLEKRTSELAQVNKALRVEIAEQEQSEAIIQSRLEELVKERTARLTGTVTEAQQVNERLEREIVERKRAEEMFSAIFFSNPVATAVTMLSDGCVIRANEAFLQLTGYSRDEIIGQSTVGLNAWAHEEEREGVIGLLREAGSVHNINVQFQRKSGEIRHCLFSAVLVEIAGKEHVLSMVVDVTASKRTEEELSKARDAAKVANRAKSEFLSNMSHEIRTPLNGVLGYAQILKRDRDLTESQRAGLEVIGRSGNHLLALINDILDLSKIEAQKMEISESGFVLRDFLDDVAAMVRVPAQQRGLAFHFEAAPGLPTGVRGDEKRLGQVLLNLLGNSVKFTDEGSVTLGVEMVGGRIRFQVKDTGIGIPETKLEVIFSPFEQVARHTRTIEGTGLGLTISRQLVQLMGGELHVESTEGVGSTFWFDLELPQVDEWTKTEREDERYIVGFKGKARRILVIDDQEDNRAILVDLLLPLGFEVIDAVNGRDGLDKACEFLPDLVLMDLVMPVMDGFEATRQIKNSPQLAHVKVIAVSASSTLASHEISDKVGCDDYIPKPVRAQELFNKLGVHLGVEWVYEKVVAPVFTGPAALSGTGDDIAFVALPLPQVRAVYEFAECGDFMGLDEQLDQIEQLGADYAPFVTRIRELAAVFQSDKICEFVEKYIKVESKL